MSGYASLDLDVDKFMREFEKFLLAQVDLLAEEMIDMMYDAKVWGGEKGFSKSELENKKAYTRENAYIDASGICVTLIQNVYGIISSYGTGENRDKSNPFWDEYKASEYFNKKVRTGDAIVGRPYGEYTNIFGQKVTSTGSAEGQEGWFSRGIIPSYGIQNAEYNYLGDRETDGEILESGFFFKQLSASAEAWINEHLVDFLEETIV